MAKQEVETIARNLIARNGVIYGKARAGGKTVWKRAPYQASAALGGRGKPRQELLTWRDGWLADLAREAERLRLNPDADPVARVCSWRELIGAYEAAAPVQFARDGRPTAATARNNVQRLERLIRDMRIGMDEPLTAARPERVEQWIAGIVADEEDDGDGRYLAACTLRQARSVWARWTREPYRRRGIVVPAMLDRWPRPAGFAPVYRDPPEDLKAVTAAGGAALERDDPGLWLAFALMRHCGMRTGDAVRARWDWFAGDPDGGAWLRWMPRKTARSSRGRRVEQRLGAEFWGLLEAAGRAAGTLGGVCVLPGDEAARRRAVEALNACMRRWGWETEKASYELRKLFISEIYNAQGLTWAVAYSGDSAATIERYYAAAYRSEAPALGIGAPAVG
jgi:integrase